MPPHIVKLDIYNLYVMSLYSSYCKGRIYFRVRSIFSIRHSFVHIVVVVLTISVGIIGHCHMCFVFVILIYLLGLSNLLYVFW